MKLTVTFHSQGRLLEGSLYLPQNPSEHLVGLLFEGSMTGATRQLTQHIAREVSEEGFACLVMDHSYYSEDEGAAQSWESPSKRTEDIHAALSFLQRHSTVNPEKIIGVGVSVGAEYLAQVCRESNVCKGLILIQGPFDDAQNKAQDLDIPMVVVDETHLDSAIDETVMWARTLFNGSFADSPQAPLVDWSLADK
ncbi:MAG: hypothetical protein OM95_12875 [Bdellovibrio sp. ArHS]|nr:MAG: hypothetical protein OM95_12875 [Bdellovibrio sp. ArHS]